MPNFLFRTYLNNFQLITNSKAQRNGNYTSPVGGVNITESEM